MKIVIIECLNCDIQLSENELLDGNYCPNCCDSNLFGYEHEVKE